MSAEFQVFLRRSPSRVEARYVESSISASEAEARVAESRQRASEELRAQYEAQLNDMRQEAVEFHQQLLGSLEGAVERWMREWESQVPELVFAGVRAVLADFELSDADLHGWVQRALQENNASGKSEVEIRLSPKNAERLGAYWEDNDLSLPAHCRLHAEPDYSEVECRVVGQSGILDASLTTRLAGLQRLWRVGS